MGWTQLDGERPVPSIRPPDPPRGPGPAAARRGDAGPAALGPALGCAVAEGWEAFPGSLQRTRRSVAADPGSTRWGARMFVLDEPRTLVGGVASRARRRTARSSSGTPSRRPGRGAASRRLPCGSCCARQPAERAVRSVMRAHPARARPVGARAGEVRLCERGRGPGPVDRHGLALPAGARPGITRAGGLSLVGSRRHRGSRSCSTHQARCSSRADSVIRPPGIYGSGPLPRPGAGPGVAPWPRACCGPCVLRERCGRRTCSVDAPCTSATERGALRRSTGTSRRSSRCAPRAPKVCSRSSAARATTRSAPCCAVAGRRRSRRRPTRSPRRRRRRAPGRRCPASARSRSRSAQLSQLGGPAGSHGGAGSGSGRVHIQDVTCTSKIGEHSAKLMRAVSTARRWTWRSCCPGARAPSASSSPARSSVTTARRATVPTPPSRGLLNFQSIEQTFEGEREE